MDEIAKDVEDAAIKHTSNILFWHVDELRGNRQSGLVSVKDRKGP
jgi:hypothetical protein